MPPAPVHCIYHGLIVTKFCVEYEFCIYDWVWESRAYVHMTFGCYFIDFEF